MMVTALPPNTAPKTVPTAPAAKSSLSSRTTDDADGSYEDFVTGFVTDDGSHSSRHVTTSANNVRSNS